MILSAMISMIFFRIRWLVRAVLLYFAMILPPLFLVGFMALQRNQMDTNSPYELNPVIGDGVDVGFTVLVYMLIILVSGRFIGFSVLHLTGFWESSADSIDILALRLAAPAMTGLALVVPGILIGPVWPRINAMLIMSPAYALDVAWSAFLLVAVLLMIVSSEVMKWVFSQAWDANRPEVYSGYQLSSADITFSAPELIILSLGMILYIQMNLAAWNVY